jgi:hypothetical protein
MFLTKLKLSVGAVLLGGGLVSLAVFLAGPGQGALAQVMRPTRTDFVASDASELRDRLEQSTALAGKLQQQVQELRAELHSLRATVLTAKPTPISKVDHAASTRSSTTPAGHDEGVIGATKPLPTSAFSVARSRQNASSGSQTYRRFGGLIFAASPTGNRVIAYDPLTRWTASLELNATKENPLKVSFATDSENYSGLIALNIEGEHITRIAVFDLKSRTWRPQDLSEPVRGQAYPNPRNMFAYDLGRHLYTFKTNSLSWDHLDLGAIGDVGNDADSGTATK